MRKTLAILYLCVGLFLLPMSAAVNASTVVNIDAEITLVNYLKAAINQNVDELLTYVNDDRYYSDEFQKAEYTNFLETKKIIDYEITDVTKVSLTQVDFQTILTFENGGVEKVPFSLEFDKVWKVIIDTNSLDENYEVVKVGDNSSSSMNITSSEPLAKWDFWDRTSGYQFYSIATFGITGTSATLLLKQDGYNPRVNDSVKIDYAIVKKEWYGDDEWGSLSVDGTVSSLKSFYMSGDGTTKTGAQVRFTVWSKYLDTKIYGNGSVNQ